MHLGVHDSPFLEGHLSHFQWCPLTYQCAMTQFRLIGERIWPAQPGPGVHIWASQWLWERGDILWIGLPGLPLCVCVCVAGGWVMGNFQRRKVGQEILLKYLLSKNHESTSNIFASFQLNQAPTLRMWEVTANFTSFWSVEKQAYFSYWLPDKMQDSQLNLNLRYIMNSFPQIS